jgi:hypothetical protein
MRLNDSLNFTQSSWIQPVRYCQRHDRLQPELGLAILAGYMNVNPLLFIGEEIEPVPLFPEYGRTHIPSLHI